MNKIMFLIFFLLIGCSSSDKSIALFDDNDILVKFKIALPDSVSYLPKEITRAKDSNAVEDFIMRSLRLRFPDTIPDSQLYNVKDPVFPPVGMDTGVLLCNRDMALYINDNAWRKYLQTELAVRKDFEQKYILSSMIAEDMYKDALQDAEKVYLEAYKSYQEERKYKSRWKMYSSVITVLLLGYSLGQAVK